MIIEKPGVYATKGRCSAHIHKRDEATGYWRGEIMLAKPAACAWSDDGRNLTHYTAAHDLTHRIGDLPGEEAVIDDKYGSPVMPPAETTDDGGKVWLPHEIFGAPAPLTIEPGKSYRTKYGNKFFAAGELADEPGRWAGALSGTNPGSRTVPAFQHEDNLIAEWREEPEAQAPDVRVCLNLNTNDLIEYGHCWPGDGGITAFDRNGRELYVEHVTGPGLSDEFHVFFATSEGFKGKAGETQ